MNNTLIDQATAIADEMKKEGFVCYQSVEYRNKKVQGVLTKVPHFNEFYYVRIWKGRQVVGNGNFTNICTAKELTEHLEVLAGVPLK